MPKENKARNRERLRELKESFLQGRIDRSTFETLLELFPEEVRAEELSQSPIETPQPTGTPTAESDFGERYGASSGGPIQKLKSLAELVPGKVIFRWEIQAPLGSSGNSQVFRALDLQLRVEVAIKVLDPALTQSGEDLAAFRREVKFGRDLKHRSLIRVLDYQEHLEAQLAVFAMPLIEGPSLANVLHYLERGQIHAPLPLFRSIFEQLLEALHEAHRNGVVHLDVKPSNILLVGTTVQDVLEHPDRAPDVVLIDFGAAKGLGEPNHRRASRLINDYVAIELVTGKPVTPASDLYSLGAIAYELLTNRHLVLGEAKSPRELRREVGPALDRLVVDMRQAKASERPDAASALARLKLSALESPGAAGATPDWIGGGEPSLGPGDSPRTGGGPDLYAEEDFQWTPDLPMGERSSAGSRFQPTKSRARSFWLELTLGALLLLVGYLAFENFLLRNPEDGSWSERVTREIVDVIDQWNGSVENDPKAPESSMAPHAWKSDVAMETPEREAPRPPRERLRPRSSQLLVSSNVRSLRVKVVSESGRHWEEEGTPPFSIQVSPGSVEVSGWNRDCSLTSESLAVQAGATHHVELPLQCPPKPMRLEVERYDLFPGSGALWIAEPLGLRFRHAPAGEFFMGSPETEPGRTPDEVWHKVKLSQSFWMSETEITRRQWALVMGEGSVEDPSDECGDTCPMTGVSWFEAITFTNALSTQAGLEPCYRVSGCRQGFREDGLCSVQLVGDHCDGFRLPTEAEWEYAARAGRTSSRVEELDETTWYAGNSEGRLQPVGFLKSNAWGLRDMQGNAAEWTWDRFARLPSEQQMDPRGPSSKASSGRVVRGGSFASRNGGLQGIECRPASRAAFPADGEAEHIGFRIVANGLRSSGSGR